MTADPLLARALGAVPADPTEPPPAPPEGWRASERALRLATVAVAAIAAALVTDRPWLLALAAAPLVLLALASPRGPRPTRLAAQAEVGTRRCFEGERVTVRITLRYDGEAGRIDPGIMLGPGIEAQSLTIDKPVVELRLIPGRWGRWSLGTVDVDLYDTGGLARRSVRVDLGEIEVFPVPTRAGLTPVPVRLPERLGEHTSRQTGEGLEVVGVRPYSWGERQRRIHWPSTTRRGAIQLNQFAAERAADTVVLLDTLADFTDPADGTSTLDETVRAAAGLTRAYLHRHDRVGLVSVGGKLRWLQPATGERQFHRIVQSVLEVRKDTRHRTHDLQRVPRPVLPPGALVYAVTPLADQRFLDVLAELADRGSALVVIEIPVTDPAAEPGDAVGQLALRLWRAQRAAMRFALRNKGIRLVAHRPGETLDLALAPLLRARVQGRTR